MKNKEVKLCECGCGERVNRRFVKASHRTRLKGLIPPNPSGLCMCGCGQKTPIAKQSHTELGYVKSEPVCFCKGHRLPATPTWKPSNPSGLCMCGCGKHTPISDRTNKGKGLIKGQPREYIKGHYNARVPLEERFWSKVNKQGPLPSEVAVREYPEIAETQCWEWLGFVNRKGYGTFSFPESMLGSNRSQAAQRAAWFFATGALPILQTLHKCDNRKCVRFLHLFEGTNQENVDDKVRKNRQSHSCGEDASNVKLTWTQVRSIRKQANAGIERSVLAKNFGVTKENIGYIVTGVTWKEEKAA